MATELVNLSNEMALAVEQTAAGVVAVQGRRSIGSSGIFWKDNLILTSAEGIRSEDGIKVLLPNGAVVGARLRVRDSGTDIAVLEVEAIHTVGLPRPEFATAPAARTGQLALAVGRTANTGPIASFGIVSGVAGEWRTWRGGVIDPFVRLDIAVYPTQSGGAAVDAEGKVIGLISTGLSRSSVFAVTAKTIERVTGKLGATGQVSRGFLGVALQPVPLPREVQERLRQEAGIMLLGVEPGGPAAVGGLLLGDVLISADGRPLSEPESLADFLERTPAGTTVNFRVLRAGAEHDIAVLLGERPSGQRR